MDICNNGNSNTNLWTLAAAAAKAATAASAQKLLQEANSVLRHAFMACCELEEQQAIRGLGAWAASAFSPLRTLLPGSKADQPATDMLPGSSFPSQDSKGAFGFFLLAFARLKWL